MIQEILGYVLIGMIGIAMLAVCYLPIYFILRKRIPLSRQMTYFLFGACILVIFGATFLEWIIFSLIDGRAIFVTEHSLNLIPFQFIIQSWAMGRQKQITQTIANVVMFLPLGFLFPVVFKRARTFWKTFVCMLLISFFIEFVQYFIGRAADIDDLMLNTFGGILGYLLFSVFYRICRDKKIWKKINGEILSDNRKRDLKCKRKQ